MERNGKEWKGMKRNEKERKQIERTKLINEPQTVIYHSSFIIDQRPRPRPRPRPRKVYLLSLFCCLLFVVCLFALSFRSFVFSFVSFHFVSFRFIYVRFVWFFFRFVSFRFVSFRFVCKKKFEPPFLFSRKIGRGKGGVPQQNPFPPKNEIRLQFPYMYIH